MLNRREVVVWCLMVLSGVALRLAFLDLPNFAPVAALALFAGFFFRHRLPALSVPLAIMLITDFRVGGYEPLLMLAVYTALALPVFVGGPLRRWFARRKSGFRSALAVVATAFGASVTFFLVTNLATWWMSGMYARNIAGLVECYAMAIPFFRYTLAGDGLFAALFFGGFALSRAIANQSTFRVDEVSQLA